MDRTRPGNIYNIYDIPMGCEDTVLYGPDGLYPVQVGDVYKDGRYKFVNKLGSGGFANVWAARDLQYVRAISNRFRLTNDHIGPTSL